MKLTATMMVSLDGVYQGPGGPGEDERDGFERGGWVASHFDEETGRFVAESSPDPCSGVLFCPCIGSHHARTAPACAARAR
jgi:hypothetical protein